MTTTLALLVGLISPSVASEPEKLTIVVMDPLAAPLSCPCVEGYAQRDYEKLADFIGDRLGIDTEVVFHESLKVALDEKVDGPVSLVIGKDSVVRSDAARSKLDLLPVARLTGKDGAMTQTGLIVVRSDDPAQKASDLEGYRVLYGPENCSEKFDAARALLGNAGVTLSNKPETSAACSDGACKIIEWGSQVRAAAVISRYAQPLLEGCGTISKGDLRVIAETEPVPFITAFVNEQLPESLREQLADALLAVATDAELLAALESLTGFQANLESESQAVDTKTDATSYVPPAIPKNDSWPGWLGRQRDGHCGWLPGRLPEDLKVVWQRPLTGPGLAGIAATSDYVIIGDRDLEDLGDEFRCYSAENGSPVWTVNYPAAGNLDYGNTPRATALIQGDRAYLQGAFGDLHCVDLSTGVILWAKNFQRDFGATTELPWGTCGSPLIADDKLIINPGAPLASIVALEPKTGEILWQTSGDEPAYGSFVAGRLGGVMQVVGHDAYSLGGWDLSTGERLWTLEPDAADDFNVPTPVVVGDKLLVTSENNGTRLYDFDDEGRIVAEPVAMNSELASDICTPVVVGDKLFAVWGDLFCLDLKNGLATCWTANDPSFRIYGSLMANGERLLIGAASGELLLVDTAADDFHVVSRLSVFDTPDAELYSHPAMVGSRLFLRGEDSLVCIELGDGSNVN